MYSGKKINSRSRGGGGNYQNQQQGQGQGQGRGGGRGRGGNHSGFTDQQQQTTRSLVQGNSGGFRGFRPSIQQDRRQLSVQGQSCGPKQEGAGPSSGRRGIRRERRWGSTPPLPSVLPQRAQSILDNLKGGTLAIQPILGSLLRTSVVHLLYFAMTWISQQEHLFDNLEGGTLAIQSILGSLLRTFLRDLVVLLLYFAMMRISST